MIKIRDHLSILFICLIEMDCTYKSIFELIFRVNTCIFKTLKAPRGPMNFYWLLILETYNLRLVRFKGRNFIFAKKNARTTRHVSNCIFRHADFESWGIGGWLILGMLIEILTSFFENRIDPIRLIPGYIEDYEIKNNRNKVKLTISFLLSYRYCKILSKFFRGRQNWKKSKKFNKINNLK